MYQLIMLYTDKIRKYIVQVKIHWNKQFSSF